MFTANQRVVVTFQDGREECGRVLYQRMSPPNYTHPGAVAVFLDSKIDCGTNYTGTIFLADLVRPEQESELHGVHPTPSVT